jgi:hypothetical protein
MYIQNNTEGPMAIPKMVKKKEKRPVNVYDATRQTYVVVEVEHEYMAHAGYYYFPESINGDYFPVEVPEDEAKTLKTRPEFIQLTKGRRPALSVVSIKADVPSALDIRTLYSLDQSAVDEHDEALRAE